jgi:hypothetical protein
MSNKMYRRDLQPWLAYRRWLWTPFALVLLLCLPVVHLIIVLWDNREDFTSTFKDLLQLLLHRIK